MCNTKYMMFSVIIPFYNAAQFLPRLEKALHAQCESHEQAHTDMEVIIVDDASHCEELSLLREAAARNNWKLLELSQNAGPGSARNAGIDAATGDYLLFLDADDELTPGAINKLANAVTQKKCDVLLFDATIINNSTEHACSMLPQSPDSLTYVPTGYALAFARSGTCGKAYHTDFVRANNLHFGTGKRHEDTVFTKSALARADKVGYLPASLYRYQIHEGSLITDTAHASFESSFDAMASIRTAAEGKFPQEIEYVYIVEVIISCVMKFYPLHTSRLQAAQLFNRFDTDFPNWGRNPYLRKTNMRYRLYAALAQRHAYTALVALSRAESIARKILHRNY